MQRDCKETCQTFSTNVNRDELWVLREHSVWSECVVRYQLERRRLYGKLNHDWASYVRNFLAYTVSNSNVEGASCGDREQQLDILMVNSSICDSCLKNIFPCLRYFFVCIKRTKRHKVSSTDKIIHFTPKEKEILDFWIRQSLVIGWSKPSER